CGQLTYNVDTRHQVSSPVKGVTTEGLSAVLLRRRCCI
ncbi:DUF2574 family protein, partial [Escherichia coli]|nr:DUF2574 family protein [Escherichia coli]